jgi:ADP-ribosylglycohydrolase
MPASAPDTTARTRASLLAGALGDALGASIEFHRWPTIQQLHDPAGLAGLEPSPDHPEALITDDTQLTIFTADALIRSRLEQIQNGATSARHHLHHAYLRWLETQGGTNAALRGELANPPPDGWFVDDQRLWTRRAPGRTCLQALTEATELGAHATNQSKGCGGVMRAAPAGLIDPAAPRQQVFTLGCDLARLTHGHPTGYLASGALAVMVRELVTGRPLGQALEEARAELATHHDHQETTAALDAAIAAADHTLATVPGPDRHPGNLAATVESLGGGWIAEEALAIAVYAALVAPDDVAQALRIAVNHSGDSDSTGAICGNLVGALGGPDHLPADWLAKLELRDVVDQLAVDLAALATGTADLDDLATRYPVPRFASSIDPDTGLAVTSTRVFRPRWGEHVYHTTVTDPATGQRSGSMSREPVDLHKWAQRSRLLRDYEELRGRERRAFLHERYPELAAGADAPDGPLGLIKLRFAKAFAAWRLSLPDEDVAARRRGTLAESGWLIHYLFDRDERGEYLDFYARHRMTNDDHVRIREDGTCESLPALEDMRTGSEDPEEDARLQAEHRARDQATIALLTEKGFWP